MPNGEQQDAIVRLSLDIADFVQKVEQVKNEAKGLSKEVEQAAEVSKRKLMEQATALSTLSSRLRNVGLAIVGGLAGLTAYIGHYGARIADLTARTGLSAEALSRLSYAAEVTESDINALLWAIKFLERQLVEASLGSEKAASRFLDIGVAWRTVSGQIRPVMEIIYDIAESLRMLESAEERAGYASRVFGLRFGPALVPLLSQGRAGLEQLASTADRLGITFSTNAAQALNVFWDSLTTLRHVAIGVGRDFVASVSPALSSFIRFVTEAVAMVGRFINANKTLSNTLFYVSSSLGAALIGIGTIGKFASWLIRLRAYAGETRNAFVMLGQSLKSLFAIMISPVGIVTAALTAIAVAITTVNIRAETLVSTTRQLADELKTASKAGDLSTLNKALTDMHAAIEKNITAINTWYRNLARVEAISRVLGAGLLSLITSWLRQRNLMPIIVETVRAMAEESAARERQIELIQREINARGDIPRSIRPLVTEYVTLARKHDEVSERIAAVERAMRELREMWDSGTVAQNEYIRAMTIFSQENAKAIEELNELEDQIFKLKVAAGDSFPEIQRIGMEMLRSLSLEASAAMSSIYSAVTAYIDALKDAYGLADEAAIDMAEAVFRAFAKTPVKEEAYRNLISIITGTMRTLRQENEQYSKEMDRLYEERAEAERDFAKKSMEIRREYEQSVINFANRLRESFGLVLTLERLKDFQSAMMMISSVMQAKTQEIATMVKLQNQYIALSYDDLSRIVVSKEAGMADAVVNVHRRLLDELKSINDQRKQLNEEYARSLDNIKDRLIRELDKYYDIRDLIGVSLRDLEILARQAATAMYLPEREELFRERIAREQWERKRVFQGILQDITNLREDYVRNQEELAKREEQARKEAQESLQEQIVDLQTNLRLLSEELAGIDESFVQAMHDARTAYLETLGEIDARIAETRANIEDTSMRLIQLSSELQQYLRIPAIPIVGFEELNAVLEKATNKAMVMSDVLSTLARYSGTKVDVTVSVPDIAQVSREIESLKQQLDSLPREKVITITFVKREIGTGAAGFDLRRAFEKLDEEGEFYGAYGP